MTEERKYQLETLAIHAGQSIDPTTMSRALPIYQTTSYGFRDTEHAANLFSLQEPGNIYTRIMNPTRMLSNNGWLRLKGDKPPSRPHPAPPRLLIAILTIAHAGDEIVFSSSLYGGTYNLFVHTLPKMGVKVHLVDSRDPENFRKAITPKTKALFAETIGNPRCDVLDIEAVAKIAHEHGIPLIVDNTLPTPYLLRLIEHGADIVVHSATKFIGGHGTSIAGVIVDSGKFDWKQNDKFPGMTEPEPSYHGAVLADAAGPVAYIIRTRVTLLRDTGAAISPFNSFLMMQGLETLHLRMERHSENALKVAEFLQSHESGGKRQLSGIARPSVV